MMRSRQGATVVEVGVLLGLIAVLLIGTLTDVGQSLKELFGQTENALNRAEGEVGEATGNPDLHIVSVSAEGGVYYQNFSGRDEISFTVTFSEPVTITGQAFLPLSLDQGSGTYRAVLSAGTGTNFIGVYTPQAEDRDYDGLELGSTLDVSGAVITDGQGRFLVDASLPTLTSDLAVEVHYNPENISSLKAWWDADDPTMINLSSSSVTAWTSKVGGHVVSQSTLSQAPSLVEDGMNGRDIVGFSKASQQYLKMTGGVLTAGDGTYTYAAVWKNLGDVSSTSVVYEQNSTVWTTGTRAALLIVYNTYGFNGEANDYHDGVPYSLGAPMRTIMRVNTSAGAQAIKILSNDASYASDTVNGASNLSLGSGAVSMGYKTTTTEAKGTYEYLTGQIAEILVFDQDLSAGDVQVINQYLTDKWFN